MRRGGMGLGRRRVGRREQERGAAAFPEGGAQSIVIQTREDGVSVDHVVLSSQKYLTARPGTAKNDTTILPQTWTPF